MEPRLSIDTTFLIDLQRERYDRIGGGAAHRFLEVNSDSELYLSAVALGEFGEGFDSVSHPLIREMTKRHYIVPVDEGTALLYASVVRGLRSEGGLIGSNDLWIGCASLRHELPLVTANRNHFRRIPGLRVLDYRDPG